LPSRWTLRGHARISTGGLDAFVFTAGTGENSIGIRTRVVGKLAWLGAAIDPAANAAHTPLTATSLFMSFSTDEELMIARHTLALLSSSDTQSRVLETTR
jgi:acetate kinase